MYKLTNNKKNKKKLNPIEERLELILYFLSDLDNYQVIKNVIYNPPKSIEVLKEILPGSKLYKLIKRNNIKELEKVIQAKKLNKFNGNIIEIDKNQIHLEQEKSLSLAKAYQYKNAINPTCFGQKSFSLIKTNYYGLGEMNILNKICIEIIFDMIYSAFDMVYNPYKIYENYNMDYDVFINPNRKINKNYIIEKKYINKIYNENNDLTNFKINENMFFFNTLNKIKDKKNKINNSINNLPNIEYYNTDINFNKNKYINSERRYNDNLKNNKYFLNLYKSSSQIEKQYEINRHKDIKHNKYHTIFDIIYNKELKEKYANKIKEKSNLSNKYIFYDYKNLLNLRKEKLSSTRTYSKNNKNDNKTISKESNENLKKINNINNKINNNINNNSFN